MERRGEGEKGSGGKIEKEEVGETERKRKKEKQED